METVYIFGSGGGGFKCVCGVGGWGLGGWVGVYLQEGIFFET